MNVKQVIEDLKNIPNTKATGLYGMGIKPLKEALSTIAPSLTHIYNASIARRFLPKQLQESKVDPRP